MTDFSLQELDMAAKGFVYRKYSSSGLRPTVKNLHGQKREELIFDLPAYLAKRYYKP